MAVRWVICPMVLREQLVGEIDIDPEDGTETIIDFASRAFMAKARTLIHGRVQVVAHVRNTEGRLALCQCRADDFSALDADPDCEYVFEDDEAKFDTLFGNGVTETPRSRLWSQGKLNRINNRLSRLGVVTETVSLDAPKSKVLSEISTRIKRGDAR